ncbi:hypothetical protein BLA29_007465, partial [Euroglyphus maynei]
MINLIHHSKNSFHHWLSTASNNNVSSSSSAYDDPLLNDKTLFDYAFCFDLLSYGVDLHDWIVLNERLEINEYHQLKQKFINLLVLVGDHCFVKMSALIVVYKDVDLFQCYTNAQLRHIEGAFSVSNLQYSPNIYTNDNYNVISDNLDKIIEQFNRKIQSSDSSETISSSLLESSWMSSSVNHLLSYCYLTYGFQLGRFISQVFHKYGLNDDAKKFAIEFGHNLGIAIKLSHLLDKPVNLMNSHMMPSDADRFTVVPIEIKKQLLKHFIGESKNLFDKHIIQRQQESTQLSDHS